MVAKVRWVCYLSTFTHERGCPRATPFSVCIRISSRPDRAPSRWYGHDMSKNGKLKKAKNVEKRRLQMEEALECIPLKEAAESEPSPIVPVTPAAEVVPAKRQPKQCTYASCRRYVDASCTVCPYCGSPLPES